MNMGGRGPRNMGLAKMPEGGMKMVMRLMGYVGRHYKWMMLAVVVCILITSFASSSKLFMHTSTPRPLELGLAAAATPA